jgi:hypothetical protein
VKGTELVDWYSIHIYYYDSDKDALILDGVRPLFRRLARQVDAVSYTRHWRFGPHLRLNVRTDGDTFADIVRPAADEIVGGFLAKRPSTRRLDPQRELPVHRRLAELEHEQGPLLPWRPDNSIQIAAYDRRSEVLGGAEIADLVADFHACTTELSFRMTEELSGPRRLARGFDLMIATAHAMSASGITKAFVSFRSHAEGFLCGFPESAGLRPAWARHYRENANALMRRVDTVVAAVADGQAAAPFIQDWIAALKPLRVRSERLALAGVLSMPVGAPSDATRIEGGLPDLSPFHRALFANPTWERTQNSPGFLVYRLMLNFTYLMLTRLGIAPVERFMLCHLAANAVEDRYGISAIDSAGGHSSTAQAVSTR